MSVSCECRVLSNRVLRRADPSSRGVLPSVCVCVCHRIWLGKKQPSTLTIRMYEVRPRERQILLLSFVDY